MGDDEIERPRTLEEQNQRLWAAKAAEGVTTNAGNRVDGA